MSPKHQLALSLAQDLHSHYFNQCSLQIYGQGKFSYATCPIVSLLLHCQKYQTTDWQPYSLSQKSQLSTVTGTLFTFLDHTSQQLVNFVSSRSTLAAVGKQFRPLLPAAGGRVEPEQQQERVDVFEVRPDGDHLVNDVFQADNVQVT